MNATLPEEDRAGLRAVCKPEGYDRSVAARAQMVLWHDEGSQKAQIAARAGCRGATVNNRYTRFGLAGLVSGCSPGSPRQIPDRIRARVLALTKTS